MASEESEARRIAKVVAANQRRKGEKRTPMSPEAKARQAAAVAAANRKRKGEKRPNMASTHTPESDAQRSASMKALWADPEHRQLRDAVFAKPEVKARMSAAATERNARPEVKAKISAASRRVREDPEFRARVGENSKRAYDNDPALLEKRRQVMLRRHQEGEFGLDSYRRMMAGKPLTPYEAMVAATLTQAGETYVPHEVLAEVNGKEMDLYLPSRRLNIEVDGPEHRQTANKASDAERDAMFTERGIKVLRLTHREIGRGTFVVKLAAALS